MNGTGDYVKSEDESQEGPIDVKVDSKSPSQNGLIVIDTNHQSNDSADGQNKVQRRYDSTHIKEAVENSEETLPPQTDNRRDADSAITRRRKEQQNRIQNTIATAKETHSIILELKEEGIQMLPPELLELSNLQYLYLEGNELTSLPDNFFQCLPELRWLDLRRNYLSYLPSMYVGSHRNLKTLLLEGNELKTLPLELSLIPTLNGLNISNNPLEFPPTDVIEKGTSAVLYFLRDLLKAKSHGSLDDEVDCKKPTQYLSLDLTGGVTRLEDLMLAANRDDVTDSDDGDHCRLSRRSRRQSQQRSSSKDSHDSAHSDTELVRPLLTSAALHKPASYSEIKQKQLEKIRRAGALGVIEKKSKTRDKLGRVNVYPEPPPAERVKERFLTDQFFHRERDLNEKEYEVVQKRKNHNHLQQWRHDGKKLQQERYQEALIYGGAKDKVDIAKKAPFGFENEHLKVPTNEERIAEAVKASHENIRKQRALSPAMQAKREAEKLAHDKQLEKRIKAHMLRMQDRRRGPKGTPQEEMEASRRELQIANQLQSEIEGRRKAMDFGFASNS